MQSEEKNTKRSRRTFWCFFLNLSSFWNAKQIRLQCEFYCNANSATKPYFKQSFGKLAFVWKMILSFRIAPTFDQSADGRHEYPWSKNVKMAYLNRENKNHTKVWFRRSIWKIPTVRQNKYIDKINKYNLKMKIKLYSLYFIQYGIMNRLPFFSKNYYIVLRIAYLQSNSCTII